MKLDEILAENIKYDFTTKQGIVRWIVGNVMDGQFHLDNDNITIDDNLTINCRNTVMSVWMKESELPIKLGNVSGIAFDGCPNLTTLKGLPYRVDYLALAECPKLTTLANCPKVIPGYLLIGEGCGIKSLEGISDFVKKCPEIILAENEIESGGLGLLLIENLEKINPVKDKNSKPFDIIREYVGYPNHIYECQAELIEHGFEEYAKI